MERSLSVVIFSIGLTLQLIVFMLHKFEFENMKSAHVWTPTLLTLIGIVIVPFIRDTFAVPGDFTGWQYFILGMAGWQILMFLLKITISTDMSWKLTFLPFFICGGFVIFFFIWLEANRRFMKNNKPEGYF